MSTFQKTVFTVVLATAFAGIPAISHGKQICYTDQAGKENCFEYVCLKPEENKTTPIVVEDPEICILVSLRSPVESSKSSRDEILKRLTDGCINAGGILEDKGSRVTCTLRDPKPQTPLKGTSTPLKGTR